MNMGVKEKASIAISSAGNRRLEICFGRLNLSTARIGIIGVGPRGLTVLERIVAHERQRKSADLEILLFDPKPPGAGCHDPEQSDIHLVNTVAGQLTQFSDASVVDAGPVMNGPSFYQWLQQQTQMGVIRPPIEARVSPDAYYPRGMFGRYLHWAFRYITALAPSHVRIIFKQVSVDRAHRDDEHGWILETPDAKVRVDYLFLTTGHTKPAMRSRRPELQSLSFPRGRETQIVDDPYPIQRQLAAVTSGMTVAVEGMGLTAFDVLAELTVGRGGQFMTDVTTGEMHYAASGDEPRIALFSRSGIPLSARAINQKGISGQYKARFLHTAGLRELRTVRKLDFVEDVLPLLVADMEYAYYDAYLRGREGPASAVAFCKQFAATHDAEQRKALVAQHIPPEDRFSWDQLAAPVPAHALSGREAFDHWLRDYLQLDVREARKGNVDGPLKAACDVMRDLRDNLRAAIEFGGLTESSHQWVLSEFMPIMNRLAVGPPLSRINELLALIKAGVVEADYGPGASCAYSQRGELMRVRATRWEGHSSGEVDVLVRARISMHSPKQDASPLLQGLLDDGHVRLFHNGSFHPGGIDIDRNHNWISDDGRIVENAWALGIPTEGIKFCTFVVPRTGVNSTALVDAGRAVARMLSMIGGRGSSRSLAPPSVLPTEEEASVFASLYGALN